MPVLDADGHVIESEAMFALLEEEFQPRRPIRATLPLDTAAGDFNAVWLLEGKVFPSFGGRGQTVFFLPGSACSQKTGAPVADQALEDVEARLRGLDRFGIDQQMIFPTMFLVSGIDDVRLEAGLFRAYNRYVSAACARSHGRLKWAALVPWRDPALAVKEVQRASDLGAAGIFTLGTVYDRHLTDPEFDPIYEACSALDLPVCIHLGWSAPAVTQLFSRHAFFCSAMVPVMWGLTHIMSDGLLARFPRLRVGFMETGAGWIPYVINQIRRQYQPPTVLREGSIVRPTVGRVDRELYRDPAAWFREGRAFTTCELDEDLPYLLRHLGEDALMLSSDYPHGDPSADENYVAKLAENNELPQRVKDKLLGGNAARFFRA